MPSYETSDGIRLSFEDSGDGPVVLLLHGFASDTFINWVRPGVADAIAGAGFRVVALDQRAHGMSDKPHAVEAYTGDVMARDARGLLDHLSVDRAHLVGYSMGAWIAARVAADDPRIASVVLGGVGEATVSRAGGADRLADALVIDDPASIDDPVLRSFRDFAELTRADRVALAALQRGAVWRDADAFARVEVPALVICGDDDPLAGPPEGLAARIGGAKAVTVGGSHLNVVNNRAFHEAVVSFLTEQEARDG